MKCIISARKDLLPFLYHIYPSESSPYPLQQKSHLVANNKSAIQCRQSGLLKSLHINDKDMVVIKKNNTR